MEVHSPGVSLLVMGKEMFPRPECEIVVLFCKRKFEQGITQIFLKKAQGLISDFLSIKPVAQCERLCTQAATVVLRVRRPPRSLPAGVARLAP